MTEDVQNMRSVLGTGLVPAVKVAQKVSVKQAPNGIRYAAYGENQIASEDLERVVQAVPVAIAAALSRKVYYFVPLAMGSASPDRDAQNRAEDIMISPVHSIELSDAAICHRNVPLGLSEGVFISTRLLDDRFALAFEFFINVGHALVECVGVPEAFSKLVWEQALKDVRGETSQDAWESRGQSILRARVGIGSGQDSGSRLHIDEKAKSEYLESAFSDAIAIYQLSLSLDFNYSELREREYPLLAPQPLAERLRLTAQLFPPNPGYEFAIRYRRRA